MIENSSSTLNVSSTKIKGFSPSNVNITLSPSLLDTFSSSVKTVPFGTYKG